MGVRALSSFPELPLVKSQLLSGEGPLKPIVLNGLEVGIETGTSKGAEGSQQSR